MSICEATGWTARFKHEMPDGKNYFTTCEVAVWVADDGHVRGYIEGDGRRGLVPADMIGGFDGYDRSAHSEVHPAPPGWWLDWPQVDGSAFREPVVAWSLATDGYGVEPIPAPDADGHTEPTKIGEFARLVYEPDHRPAAAPRGSVVDVGRVPT